MANKNFAGKAPEMPVVEAAVSRLNRGNCVQSYASPMDFGGASIGVGGRPGEDAECAAFERSLRDHNQRIFGNGKTRIH